jgi:predicted dehydrogenase
MGLRHATALEATGVPIVGFDSDPRALESFRSRGFSVVPHLADALAVATHVVVATPNHTHVPVALAALPARVPVMVEKPISLDLADARHLVSAFASAAVSLFVAHSERFHPALLALREQLAEEPIVDARFTRFGPTQTASLSPLFTHAIHDFDLARLLVGASLQITAVKRARDADVVTLVSDQGARVTVVSGTLPKPRRVIELRTPTRALTADLVTSTVTIDGRPGVVSCLPSFGIDAQARAFATLSADLATGADGLGALALATAADALARDRQVRHVGGV